MITTTVQSSISNNPSILNTAMSAPLTFQHQSRLPTADFDIGIRKFASVWFIIFVFAPIPIVLISKFTSSSEQNFGKKGSLVTKVIIVLVTAATLSNFHPMPTHFVGTFTPY